MSQRCPSQAVPVPFSLAGPSRSRAAYLLFAACLVVSFALYAAVIKAYSQDSIIGSMYRLAFWLGMEDSWSPMLTALKHIKAGNYAGVYDLIFFTDKIKFQYAITSLLFIDGLGQIFDPSYANLNIFNFGLMPLIALSLTWLAYELGFWRGIRGFILWAGACSFLVLTSHPIVAALNLGQIQLWIDLLFIPACALWIRNRRAASGFLIGLIALIKPQMAALLLWSVLRRHWSFLRGFLLAAVPLTLLSIYLYGFWNNFEYIEVLKYVAKHGEEYFNNQSVNGLLNRLFGDGNSVVFSDQEFARYDPRVYVATLISSAILVGIALCWRPGPREDRYGLDFVLAAFAFTIASPVVWEHHYGITPAIFLVALAMLRDLHAQGRQIGVYVVLFAVSFILINANISAFCNSFRSTPAGTLLQSYRFYGGLALFMLLVMLRPQMQATRSRAA